MQTIIKWQTTLFNAADPAKCYAEITSIGDEVTPEQVVEKGKCPDSELHKCFTWDDTEAANMWRMREAREVMRQLIVISKPDPGDGTDGKNPIQFRLLMKNETHKGSGYKQTIIMIQDADEYKKLLDQAWTELRTFKNKYSMLNELRDILDLIN